ncbi:MAG: hypothetical protein ACYTF7_06830 [Planctomycetota bacterium]|jgi:hypothetical protein
MSDTFSPGQRLEVTVTRQPRAEGDRKTIARLMRQDPTIKKALRGAQKHRANTLVVRSRGRRPWAVRRQCARYANVQPGATFSFVYTPQLAGDIKSVSKHLEIK